MCFGMQSCTKLQEFCPEYQAGTGSIKVNQEFSFSFLGCFLSNCRLLVFVFLQDPALWLFFLGFKTGVFNSQFLTRPDISFSRFPNFWPENSYFLVYFNRPTVCIWRKILVIFLPIQLKKQVASIHLPLMESTSSLLS
jgi:hypothetical protein